MLEVRNVDKRYESCLNCGKPVEKEVVVSYEPWYITPIQLCDKCLKLALKTLVAEKKGEDEK